MRDTRRQRTSGGRPVSPRAGARLRFAADPGPVAVQLQIVLRALAPVFVAALLMRDSAAVAAERSFRAEVLFRLENPCPATGQTRGPCRGYVIDRVIPYVCGGAEEPANMRWLTLAEAKAKSRWDRIGCRPGRKLVLPGGPAFTEAYPIEATEPPVEVQSLPE